MIILLNNYSANKHEGTVEKAELPKTAFLCTLEISMNPDKGYKHGKDIYAKQYAREFKISNSYIQKMFLHPIPLLISTGKLS